MRYWLAPHALEDLHEAAAFYDTQRRGLGSEFAVEIGLAIAAVLEAPKRWPEIEAGIRKYRLSRFPHALLYRVAARNHIHIVAIFDLRRRPKSWRRYDNLEG